MLAGDAYLASDPELQDLNKRATRLVERYNRRSVDDLELKCEILTELLEYVGEGVEIRPPFFCDYGSPPASSPWETPRA
jgi:maltose O-acetyltransferase